MTTNITLIEATHEICNCIFWCVFWICMTIHGIKADTPLISIGNREDDTNE